MCEGESQGERRYKWRVAHARLEAKLLAVNRYVEQIISYGKGPTEYV